MKIQKLMLQLLKRSFPNSTLFLSFFSLFFVLFKINHFTLPLKKNIIYEEKG